MGEHQYRDCGNDIEPRLALYVSLQRPEDKAPFKKDLNACLDTGSSITFIPIELKREVKLYPHRTRPYELTTITTYMLWVYADCYTPQLIEVAFDPNDAQRDYAILGRNLLNKWYLLLRGPECRFFVDEQGDRCLYK